MNNTIVASFKHLLVAVACVLAAAGASAFDVQDFLSLRRLSQLDLAAGDDQARRDATATDR
jgi:hypothetical protein